MGQPPLHRADHRGPARSGRDLHAQADLRPQRLGDAHAPVIVRQGEERVLPRSRADPAFRGRPVVHRRAAATRSGLLCRDQSAGEFVQAGGVGGRGSGGRLVVHAERVSPPPAAGPTRRGGALREIGRGAWRGKGEISVGAVTFKKKRYFLFSDQVRPIPADAAQSAALSAGLVSWDAPETLSRVCFRYLAAASPADPTHSGIVSDTP